ncbi:MAG: hypothetical protein WDM96_10765 [Lacunisphaera sp.]
MISWPGAGGLEIKQLLGQVLGGLVGDGAPQENLPLREELALDLGADRAGGLVDHGLFAFLFILVVETRGDSRILVLMEVGGRHRRQTVARKPAV